MSRNSTQFTLRQLQAVLLAAFAGLALAGCNGEAEMPEDTPASVEREQVSPVGADEQPLDPITPAEREATAPEVGDDER